MEYKILENKYMYKLEKEVELYLSEGWELSGGVSAYFSGKTYYAQAMKRGDS